MYCKNCGVQLEENNEMCQNCGAPVGCGNSHCKNCGAIVGSGKFCSECGAPNDTVGNDTKNTHYTGNTNGEYTANPNEPRYDRPRNSYPYKPKSRLVAGLLAIFVGCFGIHNFYLGNNNIGLIQVLVSTIGGVFTCGIATIAMEIWALVEGIFIFMGKIDRDANGVLLED